MHAQEKPWFKAPPASVLGLKIAELGPQASVPVLAAPAPTTEPTAVTIGHTIEVTLSCDNQTISPFPLALSVPNARLPPLACRVTYGARITSISLSLIKPLTRTQSFRHVNDNIFQRRVAALDGSVTNIHIVALTAANTQKPIAKLFTHNKPKCSRIVPLTSFGKLMKAAWMAAGHEVGYFVVRYWLEAYEIRDEGDFADVSVLGVGGHPTPQ